MDDVGPGQERVTFEDPELERIFMYLRRASERPWIVAQGRRRPNVVPIRVIEGGQALPAGWPEPLSDLAYRGPLGEYVEAVEPHSEADPAAILIQALLAFGNALGRGPHTMIEQDRHGTNLYAVVVGESGRARKGVSWSRAYRPVADADPDWATRNTGEGGLSTGEGLVRAVQDSDDPKRHVTDKRLMVVMEELSEMLDRMKREGNSLGAVLRLGWDAKPLAVRTRQDPLRAIGAHISLIAHVTVADLQSLLAERDVYNGFGNRFLWVLARRQRALPFGGSYDSESDEYQEIVRRLTEALAWGELGRQFEFSERGSVVWSKLYRELSRGEEGGHYSAITDRAEPIILRLAMIYAAQERSARIRIEHIKAATEVWRYCEESARFLFSNEPPEGSNDDRVLKFLFEVGGWVPRQAITTRFKNVPTLRSYHLDGALKRLDTAGLIEMRRVSTTGRPREEYKAV